MTQRKQTQLIRVSLACNDHRNGAHQGWAENANFDFPDGSEVAIYHKMTKAAELKGMVLQVGRLVVPFKASTEWYGNWCWNAYWLMPDAAFQVMRYIVQHRDGDEESISEGMAVRYWNQVCKAEKRVVF